MFGTFGICNVRCLGVPSCIELLTDAFDGLLFLTDEERGDPGLKLNLFGAGDLLRAPLKGEGAGEDLLGIGKTHFFVSFLVSMSFKGRIRATTRMWLDLATC